MRVACLVMAYIAPAVLARSVALLRAAGWDVFVHVDAKVSMASYRADMGDAQVQCHFVAQPVEVFWGGFSMVVAELRLIETARAHATYDKFVLISDDSFPVLPPDLLQHHFANGDDQITLRTVREGTPTFARYRDYVCYDDVATTVRENSAVVPGSPLRVIRPELERKIAEIAALRRRGKKKLKLFYGQSLWALTSATVDTITKAIDQDKHLRKSFEYSALPDETIFHSIIGNFIRREEQEAAPVYVNYTGGRPAVYAKLNELPLDLQPSHGFMRKLSPTAVETLDALAARLQAGLNIHGQQSGREADGLWIVDDAGARRRVIRLGAPAGEAEQSTWHDVEVFWGRRFRWTASATIAWTLAVLPDEPVRVVLSTVMPVDSEFVAGCRFAFGAEIHPLNLLNGDLYADFDRSDSPVVTLTTPPPKQLTGPRATWDHRMLGLPVAV
jgi:hypothetical protein